MKWLLSPILPHAKWGKIVFKDKRAITWDEHFKIIEREPNKEPKAFYELIWHVGGAQCDIVALTAAASAK